ncbi:aminotransferase class IV [Alistipes senegalensis]|uniref:aminotransferase class IV n=1 Tax=Alistipes senegalensis TaxID=1288121 RepID=UPI00242B4A1E|nr:aminotransferase class IV [Alistipes senegalensis]MCI7309065.1 aminotransferase class IV [Alistipes senegalensis]MDD7038624.1 aminotransferase class IV [Alistipes senegalensis]MDY2876695.1 aminotransferase class IV [Alistipes senegalensis]
MTELYLYQTVHLARGRARNAEAHAARLDAASCELFGRGYAPARLAARIEALAAAERYPTGVSGFVRIELGADGEERLTPAGVSLYDGYALRSLQPEAVTLRYDLPLTEAPTSAREAAAQLARRMAERAGADVAVRCDREGILREADDAPLFAVAGHTVLAAPGTQSVERELAVRAVRAAGLELREEPFGCGELPRIDELFFADHRGITALARCDGQPLMSLIAERIALVMEGLFPKK